MQAQVAQIAKSCYHQIRNIGQIRSSITDDASKTLVHALVTARFDYAAIRPSADNGAAFAKRRSPARLGGTAQLTSFFNFVIQAQHLVHT